MEMQEYFVRDCIWIIDGHGFIFLVVVLNTHFFRHFLQYTTGTHLFVRTCELPVFICTFFSCLFSCRSNQSAVHLLFVRFVQPESLLLLQMGGRS